MSEKSRDESERVYTSKFPHIKGSLNPKNSRGFSLFELTAFIIITAILYSVAVNRFSEFPEAAERANFIAIVNQIQVGINLESVLGLSSGSRNVKDMDGLNPMDLLLEAPSNYRGAYDTENTAELERRSWYFDRGRSELIYLVNQSDNVFLIQNGVEIPSDEIRLSLTALYRDPETLRSLTYAELMATRGETDSESSITDLDELRSSGVVLRPVIPYRWESARIENQILNENG